MIILFSLKVTNSFMLVTWHGKTWSHKLQITIVYINFIYVQANNEVRSGFLLAQLVKFSMIE